MADYQWITDRGVIVPDTADIRDGVIDEWREAFGDDLLVDPSTPQGVMITAEVEARDAVARNNAAVANQLNPDIAGGIFLDAIWALTRGTRRPAERSILTGVELTGVPGTLIPSGSLASVDDTGAQFETVNGVVIDGNGEGTVSMRSVEFGPIAAPSGSLSSIATNVLGWESVNNPTSAALGRLAESDISSRRRRRQTLGLQGTALPEAIISRVMDVEGVRSLVFRENVTPATVTIDGVSLGPHSIFVSVDGGYDIDVATALLDAKSLGAGWNGDTVVQILEPFSGQEYEVAFHRAEPVQVFARVTIAPTTVNAQQIIPQAIVAYSEGELEGDGGFVVGASVSPWELAGAINQVEPRIFVQLVELSTDGEEYEAVSIPISIEEVARTSLGSVTVITS